MLRSSRKRKSRYPHMPTTPVPHDTDRYQRLLLAGAAVNTQAHMPPRRKPLHITVHRPGPILKRIVANAIAKKRNRPKQKRRPRSGQQSPRQSVAAPAAADGCATGAQGHAGSDLPKDEERAANTAGGPVAPPSNRESDRQPGPGGAPIAAVSSAACGAARRRQGSSSGDAAAVAAAAAQREVVRQTGREVEDLCAEAEWFSELHCEWDADGMRGLSRSGNIDLMMVEELHELQEQLEDALELPAITKSMRSRLDSNLGVLGDMVEELMERNELCRRPDCWHRHFDSDSDDEPNRLWARLGCAYDKPVY